MTKVSGCLISLPAESRWWPTHANNTTLPRDSTIDTLPVTIRVITCIRYSSCLRRDALMGIKRLELSEFSGKKFYPNESGHLEVGEIPCKKIFISWIEFLIFFEICNTLFLFLFLSIELWIKLNKLLRVSLFFFFCLIIFKYSIH